MSLENNENANSVASTLLLIAQRNIALNYELLDCEKLIEELENRVIQLEAKNQELEVELAMMRAKYEVEYE